MKKILIITILTMTAFLTSCSNDNKNMPDDKNTEIIQYENIKKIEMSNMNSDKSLSKVESALKKYIESANVDKFTSYVKDYNETIENTSLQADFSKVEQPEYDIATIDGLWATKKGEFIGTNCRINTFMLLKDNINIPDIEYDDSLLFLDKDAINIGKIFNEEEESNFYRLFSKVKTESTKDYHIHAKNINKHLSNFTFDQNISMISVVIHDNLDEDCLFIGHVGVLVPIKNEYLWIEKLSFEKPYQAVKFASKKDCFNYLYNQYKSFTDETTSTPFIMENDKLVELEAYKNN